jgi:Bacterial Ig-like domain
VPVALSLRDNGKTAMIDPYPADASRALAPSKKYKVTITTGAQDLSGKAHDQNPAYGTARILGCRHQASGSRAVRGYAPDPDVASGLTSLSIRSPSFHSLISRS